MKIWKILQNERGEIFSGIAALFGGLTSGITASGVATAAGIASTAATIGSTIAQSTRREPGAKIVAPPTVAEAQKGVVEQRRKVARGLGFRDTILSRALSATAGPGGGGKTMLGQ